MALKTQKVSDDEQTEIPGTKAPYRVVSLSQDTVDAVDDLLQAIRDDSELPDTETIIRQAAEKRDIAKLKLGIYNVIGSAIEKIEANERAKREFELNATSKTHLFFYAAGRNPVSVWELLAQMIASPKQRGDYKSSLIKILEDSPSGSFVIRGDNVYRVKDKDNKLIDGVIVPPIKPKKTEEEPKEEEETTTPPKRKPGRPKKSTAATKAPPAPRAAKRASSGTSRGVPAEKVKAATGWKQVRTTNYAAIKEELGKKPTDATNAEIKRAVEKLGLKE